LYNQVQSLGLAERQRFDGLYLDGG